MAAPQADGHAKVDGTSRLSALDAAFLYFERPNQQLHVGCVAEVDGHVSFAAFLEMIEQRLCTRLPRYRQRPLRTALDIDHPHWEPDPAFDVRRHVHRVAVPAPGGADELHELVDSLHAAPLDARHPLWEIHLIEGLAGGSSALLFKIHHCMVDGVSGAQILDLVTDACGENPESLVVAATPAQLAIDQRRTTELASRLGSIPGAATILGRMRDASEAIATIASLVTEPSDPLPFNRPLSDRRSVAWTTLRFDDILAVRGRFGCKVNDVVLAVIVGALHRYLEARSIPTAALRVRAIVPVSVRRDEDHLTLGNLVTAMIPRLPIGETDPIERLRRVAAEMLELKNRGQARAAGVVLSLLNGLPAPLEALLGRLAPDRLIANTICTNVPGPRQARSVLGQRVRAVHPIAPLFQSMGLEFAILSYDDTVSISATADPELVPDLREIATALAASAAELVAATRDVAEAEPAAPVAVAVPRVSDVMSRDVLTVGPCDSLLAAHRLMCSRRVRHLPVLGPGGRLNGIVTQRDILAAASSSLERDTDAARVRILGGSEVNEVMETHLCTATPDELAAHAGARMIRHKIGCLPVVGEGGQLVGIVTQADFVSWATQHMAPDD